MYETQDTFSVPDLYAKHPYHPERRIAEKFSVKPEVMEQLRAERGQFAASNAIQPRSGLITSIDAWKKFNPTLRKICVGRLLADTLAGKSVGQADYPVPSLFATLSVDTADLVDIFRQTISELSAPGRFGELLLFPRPHPEGMMSVAGRSYSAVAEDYIFEQKLSGKPYKEVASGAYYAEYEIEQRGIQVTGDRFDLKMYPWDELGRQLRLIANGGARTINKAVYQAFLDAYGAGTRPFPNLENIGGTAASALATIDASDTTPYTGVTRTAGVIIYQDYTYANRMIGKRPNALPMEYVVVRPTQYETIQQWAASNKMAFGRILGRSSFWAPTPAYDGLVINVALIVDDDLPQYLSKNIALFCGPREYVGDLVTAEETSIFNEFKPETNTDAIYARQANDAIINNYNSWVFEYNLNT